jgi:hypothetical protein
MGRVFGGWPEEPAETHHMTIARRVMEGLIQSGHGCGFTDMMLAAGGSSRLLSTSEGRMGEVRLQ